ncbi:sugar nucleotide-binding protein [Candidatus Microgenomates bacterium]|nr:sugar nucleotide-binding protein [Candidatus Microgenomates bacterium]
MKVLLTGASSYVGARLFFDLSRDFNITGTYYGTRLSDKFIHLNITDRQEINNLLSKLKPDFIIHATANANARWCEANPKSAIALNQESTKFIVRSANEYGAKVVLVSSFAAIHPHNIYSNTKRQSELYVQDTERGYVILRPSLIIGFSPNTVNDRPFNRILKNLDQKTEAVYDTSWEFQPTYLRHISEIIKCVLERPIVNEIIPIAVPELKSRYDIANDILSEFNIEVRPIDKHDTEPIETDNLEKLKSLHLPEYSYDGMIGNIVEEIKNRKLYSSV